MHSKLWDANIAAIVMPRVITGGVAWQYVFYFFHFCSYLQQRGAGRKLNLSWDSTRFCFPVVSFPPKKLWEEVGSFIILYVIVPALLPLMRYFMMDRWVIRHRDQMLCKSCSTSHLRQRRQKVLKMRGKK